MSNCNGDKIGTIPIDTSYIFNKKLNKGIATDRIKFNENPLMTVFLDKSTDYDFIKKHREQFLTLLITSNNWRITDYYKKTDLDTINIFISLEYLDDLINMLIQIKNKLKLEVIL